MSLISTKGLYGLMAIYELYLHKKRNDKDDLLNLKKISEHLNISSGYLEQLFIMLKKAKIVKSIRGSKGGYILINDKISIKEILIALEGDIVTTKIHIENPLFSIFLRDCDAKLDEIFNIPISNLDEYRQSLTNNIDFTI